MRDAPPRHPGRAYRAKGRARSVVFPVLLAMSALASEPRQEKEPLPSGLGEKIEKRLVQLDVSVEGTSADMLELTAADFEVLVAGREIAEITVDRLCPSADSDSEPIAAEPGQPSPASAPPKTAPATFVFFFDQPHLTIQGRVRGLDTARDLVRRLIRAGNQGMIVSSARDLKTVVPLTQDPEALLSGLDRLEKDLKQWDSYASTEDGRVRDILGALSISEEMARSAARGYKREEHWQARRSLDRMAIFVAILLETKPPKGLFYFADTLRQKAGLHYCHLVAYCDVGEDLIPEAAFEFDRAIDEAAKFGVRIYPVQAEGLTAEGGERVSHAEQGLRILAAETGGEAMIRGMTSARFAQRVLQRVSCIYLVSFDPKDLPRDKALPITVRVKRPGLRTRVQGRLVIQSESDRATSRLLTAFAAPAAKEGDFPVRVEIVALSYEKKRYRTLVQLKVPRTVSTGNEMDLGASLLGSGRVREDFSARLRIGGAGLPFVLEKEVEISPGPFEIVAVGHDIRRDEVGTGRAEGTWPDPQDAEATVSPIALLQETSAAFSRDGKVRTSGALALSEDEPVRTDRGAAAVTLVCRQEKSSRPIRIERALVGETRVEFAPLELSLAKGPCIQVRDVIPAKVLGPGSFRYELRVTVPNRTLAEATRRFVVVGAEAPRPRAPLPPQGTATYRKLSESFGMLRLLEDPLMASKGSRKERDSMGEMEVPTDAYYGASTQRAVLNFPISGLRMPRRFLRALGLVKWAAALVNRDLGLLDPRRADAIARAALEVADGALDDHFVVDVFQTGSGTSTNMNANEVIANRAAEILGAERGSREAVHPNDHVNLCQSSNDVIPTALHLGVLLAIEEALLPAVRTLRSDLEAKSKEFWDVIKTGRTHLQDATPIRMGQVFLGYAGQMELAERRLAHAREELTEVALGGTAVGSGINTHPDFARRVCSLVSEKAGTTIRETSKHFQAQATLDAVLEASGSIRTVAVSLLKIANDVRWLGSGPRCGLGELSLPEVQPGSSIMPGKVNPVIAEALIMATAQTFAADAAVLQAGEWGFFELNTMMPVAAHHLIPTTEILGAATRNFAEKCIRGARATERGPRMVEQGLSIVTGLAPVVGYDKAAAIAKEAARSGRTIREVAREMTSLSEDELSKALDPFRQTEPSL